MSVTLYTRTAWPRSYQPHLLMLARGVSGANMVVRCGLGHQMSASVTRTIKSGMGKLSSPSLTILTTVDAVFSAAAAMLWASRLRPGVYSRRAICTQVDLCKWVGDDSDAQAEASTCMYDRLAATEHKIRPVLNWLAMSIGTKGVPR